MNLESSKIKAPFTVPEGYFSGLEERLLSEVKISGLPELSVPEGYFEALEDRMIALARISSLQPATPLQYFDMLEEQVLSRVKIDGLAQPAVEKDYFAELETRILAEVHLEGLKQPAVPEGYFETLESTILNKTADAPKGKFILFRNIRVLRGAAAAAIIGLAAYWGLADTPQTKDELANISSAAMIAYLSEQPLMEEDLNFVLDEDDVFMASEISDSEISAYLLENGINI